MDVDLLRPGTVPISPDTILWFEFLLDPNLLKNHLAKPTPDPSAADLMVKFSTLGSEPLNACEAASALRPAVASELTGGESPHSPGLTIVETPPAMYSNKHRALKILCLKLAAHMRWDLNEIENKLPPHIQSQLVQDLVFMATDGNHCVPPVEVADKLLSQPGVRFAFTMYHRWLLRFLVNRALLIRQSKQAFLNNVGVMSTETGYMQISPAFDKLVRSAEDSRLQSVHFLTQLAETHTKLTPSQRNITVPTMGSFSMLTEDCSEPSLDWCGVQGVGAGGAGLLASGEEFLMQLHYDLCCSHFFHGQYAQADKHIRMCDSFKDALEAKKNWSWEKLTYASLTRDEISGFLQALGGSGGPSQLLRRLQAEDSSAYSGLVAVLQEDNLTRSIPHVHRQVKQLDLQGSSSSGIFTVSRDLLTKVAALNAVRSVLEGDLPSTHLDFNNRMKAGPAKFTEALYWAFAPVITSKDLSEDDKTKIKNFFLHLATSQHDIPLKNVNVYLQKYQENMGATKNVISLFSVDEIDQFTSRMGRSFYDIEASIPVELLSADVDLSDFDVSKVVDLEVGCLRQKLIDATTADRIRECLVKLAVTKPVKPLWTVNPQWKLPIPLQSVVMSLPRGFLQDFSYILLGKARQLSEMGDHTAGLELLLILETETRNQLGQGQGPAQGQGQHPAMYKLCKMVAWEALLMQITQVLAEWPHHRTNMAALMNKCSMCIMAVQSGDSVIPRLEIVEQCYMCLVNGGQWEGLTGRGSGPAEAAAAVAKACHHIATHTHKLPEDLWEMMLPIFATQPSAGSKRSSTGCATNNKMKDGMSSFLSRLRDPTALSVLISLLARLFNVLKDDSNVNLTMDYVNLWPSTVSNTNTYSIKSVSETLHQLLTQALHYYPENISWMKLLGDLNLVGGHYSAAMKHYLSALTILSDHFVRPLTKQLIEDQTIFKRMIKCCTQLNCPTQAAILCQFLDETDYVLAFKCLAEMSQLCSDAMDSYYGCIWDTSILEYLINLHHKRGETHRKQLAVKVMGMLELNCNNNEEIQREAANSRKAKFMRALVRQYVC